MRGSVPDSRQARRNATSVSMFGLAKNTTVFQSDTGAEGVNRRPAPAPT